MNILAYFNNINKAKIERYVIFLKNRIIKPIDVIKKYIQLHHQLCPYLILKFIEFKSCIISYFIIQNLCCLVRRMSDPTYSIPIIGFR